MVKFLIWYSFVIFVKDMSTSVGHSVETLFSFKRHYSKNHVATISIDTITGNLLDEMIMTEAGLLPLEKKKKKKKSKSNLEEVPALQETNIEEVESHKTQKRKKKKKKKSKETEKDENRPAEVHCEQMGEGKKRKKRKHGADSGNVTTAVKEESADFALPQEVEVKKKKKKGRVYETASGEENTQAEVTLPPVQTDSEAVPQKPLKPRSRKSRKSRKARGNADDLGDEEELLMLDDAVRAEILEFLPNYKFSSGSFVKKTIKYDLPRFREFRKQGIPIRLGKFTATENMRLKHNVKEFLALSGIKSEFHLFRPQRYPEEKDRIFSQRKALNFLMRLCEGVPRSWHTILSRARKMCDKENYKGRFTEEENTTLMRLHKLHGTNWTVISDKMGRSTAAVQKRFAMLSRNHGRWSEAEFKRLLISVRQLLLERAEPGPDGSLVIKKMDLYKRLAWVAVSEKVEFRSWIQCREKWMDYLTQKMSIGGRIKGRKSLEGEIQLIKLINEMVVEDSADIVWDDLTHLFGNTPPDYLQMRFHQLKLVYVPGWKTMPFCDIIDHLYEKTLPVLEKELKSCEEEEVPTETRQFYKLSEVFPDL